MANEDWGDPREYSITINRKGEGLDSEYNLVPSPKAPTPDAILRQYEQANVRLELLYEGKDPFDPEATVTAAPADTGGYPQDESIQAQCHSRIWNS